MVSQPRNPRRHQFVASGLFDGRGWFSALERRIEQLPSEKRGDALEEFAEAYEGERRGQSRQGHHIS